jgi:hypothetical protein
MIARAAWAGLLFLLATGPGGCPPCATVYRIAGKANPKSAYNILFMGSGFGEKELPAYRQVVQEYAEKVLATEGLLPYRDAINVYRIDLTSGPPVSRCPGNGCGVGPIGTHTSSVALGTPVASSSATQDTLEIDLRTHQCWDPDGPLDTECRILWLHEEGQVRALEQAFCAPNISAVVVIVNLNARAGGGSEDALSAGVGLTVVGAPAVGATDGSMIGATAVALLEHELGHVLGLYDEYTSVAGTPVTSPRNGRNVWRPNTPAGQGCAAWVPPLKSPNPEFSPPLPWQSEMDPKCGKGLEICTERNQPSEDHCPWTPAECPTGHCSMGGNYCAADALGRNESVPPGLWEGAHYQEDCYYRASPHCRMRELDHSGGMCPACRLQINRVLCLFGPPFAECPTAY